MSEYYPPMGTVDFSSAPWNEEDGGYERMVDIRLVLRKKANVRVFEGETLEDAVRNTMVLPQDAHRYLHDPCDKAVKEDLEGWETEDMDVQ